ncbi:MAG: hypothetical protein WA958_06525 [Tunicatimonas sp.]
MKYHLVLFYFVNILVTPALAQDMILPDIVTNPESVVAAERQEIDHSQLPSPVVRALDEGTYEGMDITEVFVLQGDALKYATAQRTDLIPRMLYELRLWDGEQLSVVYFTEQGEVYEADRRV